MARTKGQKWKLNIKYFEVRERMPQSDEVTALCVEVTLPTGGVRRSAVAFYSKPTLSDLSAAAKELKRWSQFQLEKWDKTRTNYINEIIN